MACINPFITGITVKIIGVNADLQEVNGLKTVILFFS